MKLIKRFAYWPLLALGCATICSAISNADHGTTAGTLVGLGLSVPIAAVIDHRRGSRTLRS